MVTDFTKYVLSQRQQELDCLEGVNKKCEIRLRPHREEFFHTLRAIEENLTDLASHSLEAKKFFEQPHTLFYLSGESEKVRMSSTEWHGRQCSVILSGPLIAVLVNSKVVFREVPLNSLDIIVHDSYETTSLTVGPACSLTSLKIAPPYKYDEQVWSLMTSAQINSFKKARELLDEQHLASIVLQLLKYNS